MALRTSGNAADGAANYVQTIQDRDWGAAYDMASSLEKSLQPWGRDQFIIMMDQLTKDWPKDMGNLELEADKGALPAWQMFMLKVDSKLVAAGKPNAKMHNVIFAPMYRDESGWHPRIFDLPMGVCVLGSRPDKEKIQLLIDACKAAKIKTLVRMDDKMKYSIERLEQYQAGKLPASRIMHRDPAQS